MGFKVNLGSPLETFRRKACGVDRGGVGGEEGYQTGKEDVAYYSNCAA